jgi:hypothetical protein
VKGFYQEKSHEISQRIDGLLESVASSVKTEKKNHHRRSSSLEGWIVKKFGPMIHGDRLRTVREHSLISTIEAVFAESFDDDAAKEHDRVKNTDSIKRAITDVYRTAKLLHNFSILVSPYFHQDIKFVPCLQSQLKSIHDVRSWEELHWIF